MMKCEQRSVLYISQKEETSSKHFMNESDEIFGEIKKDENWTKNKEIKIKWALNRNIKRENCYMLISLMQHWGKDIISFGSIGVA